MADWRAYVVAILSLTLVTLGTVLFIQAVDHPKRIYQDVATVPGLNEHEQTYHKYALHYIQDNVIVCVDGAENWLNFKTSQFSPHYVKRGDTTVVPACTGKDAITSEMVGR